MHGLVHAAALEYRRREWRVVPIPYRRKAPILSGWPDRRLEEADLDEYFRRNENVGLLTGEASGGLIDVDLDAPEAVGLAENFLPHTDRIHGRPSKRRCHHWYLALPAPPSTVYQDIDGTVLVELRSTKRVTLVPPSLHPTGERLEWEAAGEPATVHPDTLARAVARVASAALLARHWPHTGARHETALALSGALLRNGWTVEETEQFVDAVTKAAGDEEARARVRDVLSTERRLAAGGTATGLPALSELVGEEVTRIFANWVGIDSDDHRDGVPAQRIRFLSGAEIASSTPEEVEWISRPWVAVGAITEVNGKVKTAGKTTWLTRLARAVVEGALFMGQPTMQSPVVYLTEQSLATFRVAMERANLLGRSDFTVLVWSSVAGIPWPEVIHAAVAECRRRGARLLIVDTLSQFSGSAGDGENDAGEALVAMRPLQKAAAEGLGVVVCRHERKSGGGVSDAGRGSSAFSGAVDTVLVIRRPEGNGPITRRVLYAVSRLDGVPSELLIELTADGYQPLGGTADFTADAAILAAMPPDESSAVPRETLAGRAGLGRTVTNDVLDRLLAQGRAMRKGRGVRRDPHVFWAPEISSAGTASHTAEAKSSTHPQSAARAAPSQNGRGGASNTLAETPDGLYIAQDDLAKGGGVGQALLRLGQSLEWRVGPYAPGRAIAAGKPSWVTFIRAHPARELQLAWEGLAQWLPSGHVSDTIESSPGRREPASP